MSAQKKQEKNLPQIKTQQKWGNDYLWLDFPNDGMKCLLCCEKSDTHLKSTEQKDKKNAEEAGETYRRKVIFSTTQNSPMMISLNKALVKEKESSHKLFKVPYLI